MCVCVCVCVYIHTYTHIYIYKHSEYIYTHTHTHTYTYIHTINFIFRDGSIQQIHKATSPTDAEINIAKSHICVQKYQDPSEVEMQLLNERSRDTKLWAQSDNASKSCHLACIGFHRLNSTARQQTSIILKQTVTLRQRH